MQNFKRTFWSMLAVLVLLWLVAEPTVFQSTTFFALRGAMVQLSGIVAIGCMSVAMMLALRPRWPERWLGGLDKMYRLHKWLGIAALVIAIIHWLWSKGPKWAVGWACWSGRRADPGPLSKIHSRRSLRTCANRLKAWANGPSMPPWFWSRWRSFSISPTGSSTRRIAFSPSLIWC